MKIEDNDYPLACSPVCNIFKFPIQIELNNMHSTRKQNFPQKLNFRWAQRGVKSGGMVETEKAKQGKESEEVGSNFHNSFLPECNNFCTLWLSSARCASALSLTWSPQIMQLHQQLQLLQLQQQHQLSAGTSTCKHSGCILLLWGNSNLLASFLC